MDVNNAYHRGALAFRGGWPCTPRLLGEVLPGNIDQWELGWIAAHNEANRRWQLVADIAQEIVDLAAEREISTEKLLLAVVRFYCLNEERAKALKAVVEAIPGPSDPPADPPEEPPAE